MRAELTSRQIEIEIRVEGSYKFVQTSPFRSCSSTLCCQIQVFCLKFQSLNNQALWAFFEAFKLARCNYEDRRLLRPCSFSPCNRKLTLVHGYSKNSVIATLVWPWRCCSPSKGISQSSLLFEFFVLYEVNTKVKKTQVMSDTMIVYAVYFTELYTKSINDCDDLCSTYCTLLSCYQTKQSFCRLVDEECGSWTFDPDGTCFLYKNPEPPTVFQEGWRTGIRA